MKDEIKISIVIPCYNQQEFLPDAIESVFNQVGMIGGYELIVVDDGSTDHSLEIAKKYQSNFFRKINEDKSGQFENFKIIKQVNKGLSSARNAGIMNAVGEWVLPLDADDILMEECLSKIWHEIAGFHPPDVVGLSFKEFGMRNREVILMEKPTIEDFKTGNRIGYCSAIRRSALLEVGGYSSKMWCGYEDYHLWFNLLRLGKKFITIPEVLWLYRTKEHSMINDAQAHHAELMAQIQKDFPDLALGEVNTPLPK